MGSRYARSTKLMASNCQARPIHPTQERHQPELTSLPCCKSGKSVRGCDDERHVKSSSSTFFWGRARCASRALRCSRLTHASERARTDSGPIGRRRCESPHPHTPFGVGGLEKNSIRGLNQNGTSKCLLMPLCSGTGRPPHFIILIIATPGGPRP